MIENSCARLIYIKGSERPGTEPSVADPTNILGGAKYDRCDLPGFEIGRARAWLCKKHFNEEQEFLAAHDFAPNMRPAEPKDAYKDLEPYPFKTKPPAKSSTNVLNASVCQNCGCKLDGKALRRACDCRCHKDGVR